MVISGKCENPMIDVAGGLWLEPIITSAGFTPVFVNVDNECVRVGGMTVCSLAPSWNNQEVDIYIWVERMLERISDCTRSRLDGRELSRNVDLFVRAITRISGEKIATDDEGLVRYMSLPPHARLVVDESYIGKVSVTKRFPEGSLKLEFLIALSDRMKRNELLQTNVPASVRVAELVKCFL